MVDCLKSGHKMSEIRIYFILLDQYNDELEAPEIMIQAYESCTQNVSNVSWIYERDFESLTVNKTDVVVLEEFKGAVFEKLKTTKAARIVGPWAVSVCLMEGKPIPNYPWPINNVAMTDCVVTCSLIGKAEKLKIKEMVQSMGGCYTDTLVEKNTHLITTSPRSQKYLIAAKMGASIMLPSWIEEVWESSQNSNIHGNDERFTKHRCLPFQNLKICSTGFKSTKDRARLSDLIVKNGGELTGALKLAETDILICHSDAGVTSEKYKAARQSGSIKYVTLDWVYDSVEKGYALPHDQYIFNRVMGTSTPTKEGQNVDPNFSVMSAIGGPERLAVVEETVNGSMMFNNINSKASTTLEHGKRKASVREENGQLVEKLDIKKAKRAGQYLDGCVVYVGGFDSAHREKLCKIINLSGATRYDAISDRVTHVVVGDPACHEVKLIKSKSYPCALVSLHWLLDSIEHQKPVNEEKYLLNSVDFDSSEFSSPLSKKGLNLLKSNKTITEKDIENVDEASLKHNMGDHDEDDIMKQYLNPGSTADDDTLAQLLKNADNSANFTEQINQAQQKQVASTYFKPNETSTQQSNSTTTQDELTEACEIFEGLKFLLIDFEECHFSILKDLITSASGEVVTKNFKGIPDYAVLPVFNSTEFRATAQEIVNDLWVTECRNESTVCEIMYYHRTFALKNTNPLENCVVTISSYSSYERDFLKKLINALGGLSQEQFARVTLEQKGVKGCTHLVSPEATGKKYGAALKWGIPVVTKDWLLECARTGTIVPEVDFLLGDSKIPEREKQLSLESQIRSVSQVPNLNSTSMQMEWKKPLTASNRSAIDTPENKSRKVSDSSGTPVQMEEAGCSKTDRMSTPVSKALNESYKDTTPVNQRLRLGKKDTPDACSQVTPVNKIIQEARRNNLLGTPESPRTYYPWDPKTPDTPLECCLTPNPNPTLRKEIQRYLNNFPDFEPLPPRRLSTPLSEIKRQIWNKLLKRDKYADDDKEMPHVDQLDFDVEENNENDDVFRDETPNEEVPENPIVNNKLKQLEEMLSASGGSRRSSRNFQSTIPAPVASTEMKDSQAFTVGWDYMECENKEAPNLKKIFMMSGIDNDLRQTLAEQIEQLGASVSDLSNYDPCCTHLICPKPGRNEKTLSCVAGGKWILHTSYVEKSSAAGHFLSEEEFEFGNPKAASNIPKFDRETETRLEGIYWWRREITRRGYGAFNDIRAIVVANRKDSIIRVIEAGGGVVIDVSPPFDDTVHATHCLMEPRAVSDYQVYTPLAEQGIFCVNTLYISDYLSRTSRDIRDCILPYFTKYYARS